MSTVPDVVIGICRSCSRQRQLWLPGRICGKCIENATAKAVRESRAALLAALEEELGDDSE